jgi:hypothetical protein
MVTAKSRIKRSKALFQVNIENGFTLIGRCIGMAGIKLNRE